MSKKLGVETEKRMKKNLLDKTTMTNTLWSFFGKIIAMIFLVLLDVIAARLLSVDGYAEWVFFFSILTMLFYIGWMGINTSAKVYVSKSANICDRNKRIQAALILRLIISFGICFLIFLIVPHFAEYLGYPLKYPELKTLLEMAAVLVFFNSFTELFKEICIGLEEYKYLFILTISEYAGYFIYSALILFACKKVHAIPIGYFISGICILILGYYILKNKIGFRKEKVDAYCRNYMKNIMKYALPIAVISFGGLILIEMDTFMLGLLSTKREVATYSIAKNLCSKATHVNYALTIGTMTSFSVLTVENISEKRKKFKKISILNWSITVAISAVMLVLSVIAITIVYGKEYQMAGNVMRLLVPYYVLYSVSNFYSTFLDFRGKAHFRSICYMSIIIINLVLNYVLIPVWGAKGAAIATDISLIPYTIAVIIGTVLEFRHQLKTIG